MSYSASLSSCTSRALRASVHTFTRTLSLSLPARARRHAARCSSMPSPFKHCDTVDGALPTLSARASRLTW
eukprot:scaffold3504_cov210-Prasinococcus_capsulatus_cf.AAC.1